MTTAERQALVVDYMPLAHKLAWNKKAGVPRCVSIEELKAAAYLGLVDAASRAAARDRFFPHARIIGEMDDYLRSLRWGSRSRRGTAISIDPGNDRYGSDRCYTISAGIMRAA
jgi:DNA-directed RNA polymerase specialized sigma subunit